MSAYLVSLCSRRRRLRARRARVGANRRPQGPVGRRRRDDRHHGDGRLQGQGLQVSATVVGRNGEVLVQLRGDGTGPHTMENSFKKAFTARTFRIASGEMEKRLKDNPQMGAQYLTGFTTARGALPIKIGDDVVGAAGVSGAPGGEKDEACVQTGLDKVKDQLK